MMARESVAYGSVAPDADDGAIASRPVASCDPGGLLVVPGVCYAYAYAYQIHIPTGQRHNK